jgi:RNA polymerase sigma factor (sigma-70 family)
MNGCELLDEFRERQSETAFAELVRRYTDLVFSVAKRRLNVDSLAEEVAQLVFMRLAKAPPKLSSEAALLGWLHRTSVHVAIDLWRADSRRRAREEKAVQMQSIEANENVSQLALEVDEALNELTDADRHALLLRFFDGRKMRELGEALGISEDAAKMRVSRSLERLREKLAARGVQASVVALAGFLAEEAITAAPVKLAAKISAAAGLGAGGSWLAMSGAAVKLKLAGAFVGLGIVAVLVFSNRTSSESKPVEQAPGAPFRRFLGSSLAPEVRDNERNKGAETIPDARKLLEGVARARNRIFSGSIEFEMVSTEHRSADVPEIKETNEFRALAVFDGSKRRIEQIGNEYAYVGSGSAGEHSAQMIKERKLNRGEAMQAGFLEEFEARYVSSYDGAAVLEYRERGGKPDGTTIAEVNDGPLAMHFDQRCLGLRLSGNSTVESALGLNHAIKPTLTGQEMVEGTPTWHIESKWNDDVPAEYWVSVAQPERLLKHAMLGEVFVSRYSNDKPRDPLPIEVIAIDRHAVRRLTRGATQYNIPVDPALFTLAGLGMPRGTSVSDRRSHRQIGYWTGDGLSGDLPKKGEGESAQISGLSLRERISFLETEPESERGFEAATWILLNTPDGEEVAKAGKALIDHHLRNTNLFSVAERLETLRPRCQKELLKGILQKNPVAEIRCRACFSLAMTLRDEAEYGVKKKETGEARTYFQRVITEFSKAGNEGFDKARKSEKAIREMDTVWDGCAVPNFEAKTVAGESFKLADYSGRVVVIFFRTGGGFDFEWHQKLHAKFAPKGVQFVDIVCEKSINTPVEWPMILDGNYGTIGELFMIREWTSAFVIGKDGRINARNLLWDLDKGIEAALSN